MTGINIDNDINHDEPCLKEMRVPVLRIVGTVADSLTIDEHMSEYPWLKRESIYMALAYTGDSVRQEIILPVGEKAHVSKSDSL